MTETSSEVAAEITHSLDDSVSKFVFEQGILRLQAIQEAAHALDGRATQVAIILFTAAALAAGVVGTRIILSAGVAAFAMAMFLWGGLIVFRSVRSDEICLPGLPISWWRGALSQQNFTENDARAWAAGEVQQAIDRNEEENEKRADRLNASLRCAAMGATLVGVAAVVRAFGY